MQALCDADAEKRRLLRRVNTSVEEERRSIALEIHDALNAVLVAARLEAQRIAALAREVEPQAMGLDIARRAQTVTQLTLGLSTAAARWCAGCARKCWTCWACRAPWRKWCASSTPAIRTALSTAA